MDILAKPLPAIISADDDHLKYAHTGIHLKWQNVKDGKFIEGWTRSKLIRYHNSIVKELLKRKFSHFYHSDLDDTLPLNLRNQTKKEDEEKNKKIILEFFDSLNAEYEGKQSFYDFFEAFEAIYPTASNLNNLLSNSVLNAGENFIQRKSHQAFNLFIKKTLDAYPFNAKTSEMMRGKLEQYIRKTIEDLPDFLVFRTSVRKMSEPEKLLVNKILAITFSSSYHIFNMVEDKGYFPGNLPEMLYCSFNIIIVYIYFLCKTIIKKDKTEIQMHLTKLNNILKDHITNLLTNFINQYVKQHRVNKEKVWNMHFKRFHINNIKSMYKDLPLFPDLLKDTDFSKYMSFYMCCQVIYNNLNYQILK